MTELQTLPTEILDAVCLFCDRRTLYQLCLTSQQLHSIARPVLYRFGPGDFITVKRTAELFLTLCKSPALLTLCRSLRLPESRLLGRISSAQELVESTLINLELLPPKWKESTVFQLISRSAHPTPVSLSQGSQERCPAQIDFGALAMLSLCLVSNVRTLQLTPDWLEGRWNLHWKDIFERGGLQSLDRVRVGGASPDLNFRLPTVPLSNILLFSDVRILELRDLEITHEENVLANSISATSLTITGCKLVINKLPAILSAFRGLESFECRWWSKNFQDNSLLNGGVHNVLGKHTSTLRYIRLKPTLLPTGFEKCRLYELAAISPYFEVGTSRSTFPVLRLFDLNQGYWVFQRPSTPYKIKWPPSVNESSQLPLLLNIKRVVPRDCHVNVKQEFVRILGSGKVEKGRRTDDQGRSVTVGNVSSGEREGEVNGEEARDQGDSISNVGQAKPKIGLWMHVSKWPAPTQLAAAAIEEESRQRGVAYTIK
jgi:hypothetical protein